MVPDFYAIHFFPICKEAPSAYLSGRRQLFRMISWVKGGKYFYILNSGTVHFHFILPDRYFLRGIRVCTGILYPSCLSSCFAAERELIPADASI